MKRHTFFAISIALSLPSIYRCYRELFFSLDWYLFQGETTSKEIVYSYSCCQAWRNTAG